MGREWIKIKETGQLFLEKILVSFDVPILFVCADYENRKYLCLNIDDETGESVIVATDNKRLIAMLKNEITMESVFRNSVDKKVIIAEYNFEKEKIYSHTENSKSISANMLPKKNEYFELTNKVIEEYISYLERQRITVQNETFSRKTSFVIEKISIFSNFDIGDVTVFSCGNVVIAETKNKCSYDIKEENKMIA